MQKISMRKLSVLGLVLMAASAVTAAVLPSNGKTNVSGDGNNNGTLRNGSGSFSGPPNVLTCEPRAFDEENSYSCTASTLTTTTGPGRVDSTVGPIHQQTQGNTSFTKAVAGDQQSVLIP